MQTNYPFTLRKKCTWFVCFLKKTNKKYINWRHIQRSVPPSSGIETKNKNSAHCLNLIIKTTSFHILFGKKMNKKTYIPHQSMNTIIVAEFGADWHVFHGKQTNVLIQKLCPTIWMRPGMIDIFPKVISICCVKTEIKETS